MKLIFSRLLESMTEKVSIDSESFTQETFVKLLATSKALLIRADESSGTTPLTVDDFAQILSNLHLTNYPYVGGAAPRRIIPVNVKDTGGNENENANVENRNMVYTANEAPPDMLIPFHHELAQCANPPQYLFFYCEQPSETGGETALIDSTLVYRFANDNFPDFMAKLTKYG